MLESGSLNYHNMLIQEYKQVLSQANHGCGYPIDPDVLKLYLLSKNHQ